MHRRFSPLEPYQPRHQPKRAFPPIIRALSSLLAAHSHSLAQKNLEIGASVKTPRFSSDGKPNVPYSTSNKPRSASAIGLSSTSPLPRRKGQSRGLSAAAAAAAVVAVAGTSQGARVVAQRRVMEVRGLRKPVSPPPSVADTYAASDYKDALPTWQQHAPGLASGGSGGASRTSIGTASRDRRAATSMSHRRRGARQVNTMVRVYTGTTPAAHFSDALLGPPPEFGAAGMMGKPTARTTPRPTAPHSTRRSKTSMQLQRGSRRTAAGGHDRPTRAGTSMGPRRQFIAREPPPTPVWEGPAADNPIDRVIAWKQRNPSVFGGKPARNDGTDNNTGAGPAYESASDGEASVDALAGVRRPPEPGNGESANAAVLSTFPTPKPIPAKTQRVAAAYSNKGRPGLSERRLDLSLDAMQRGVAAGGTWDGPEMLGGAPGAAPLKTSFVPPYDRRRAAAAKARAIRAQGAPTDVDGEEAPRRVPQLKLGEVRTASGVVEVSVGAEAGSGIELSRRPHTSRAAMPRPAPPARETGSSTARVNRPTRPGRPKRPAFMSKGSLGGVVLGMRQAFGGGGRAGKRIRQPK